MLKLLVPGQEYFDEITKRFFVSEDFELELEHSLVSLSKWESTWEKPFLGPEKKSDLETFGYVVSMTTTPNVSSEVYQRLTNEHLTKINDYINLKMSATWFREDQSARKSREVVTAEIIYHWMISLEIPMDCENWHLNRLLTLIKVRNQKNSKPQKRSQAEILAERRRLNDIRRAETGSPG